MNRNYPDLSIFKQFAQDNLAVKLQYFDGTKDLVIDEEIMKPLDHITGVTFLRKYGVDKIYKLQDGGNLQGCDKRLFIIRPYADRVKLLADSIMFDKSQGKQRSYHVVFTPKQLSTCVNVLEREGVCGDVSIDELPLDIIPLDVDLLSFEMPLCYKEFFMDEDNTWLHTIAHAMCTVQSMFGSLAKGSCFGAKSKMLIELYTSMLSDERPSKIDPEIGSFIVMDRDLDLVSMLLSQLTYEGLLAETFGIKSSIVEFGKNVTGSDQKARLNLNSSDQVFSDIRGMHITNVFPLLSHKAKQLQGGYEKRNQLESVQEFKQFVSEDLKILKQQHKSLALHIGACEAILLKKSEESFEDCLLVEQSLIEESKIKDCVSYIETCICKQSADMNCLRLLCLLSVCKGGIDSKLYKSLKLMYIQSFGYQHLISMKCLKDAGLFNENAEKRNLFPKIRKKFNLIPKDPDAITKSPSPKDVAYVFGGAYTPFLIKLVELTITKGLAGSLEDSLKSMQIPASDFQQGASARQSGGAKKSSKTILVIFLGGCSHTEINALRFLGKQMGFNFVIMTTAIMTAEDLLKTIATV